MNIHFGDELVDIKTLFKYNWYARRQFLKSMGEISWETVTESCGASFDSIRDIYLHSLQMEQIWIRRLSGKSIDGTYNTAFPEFQSVKLIQAYTDTVEAEINEFLDTLTDTTLKKVSELKGRDGKINYYSVEDILIHIIEEEIHHRGELICIYWQHDIQPPYTSYMAYVGSRTSTPPLF